MSKGKSVDSKALELACNLIWETGEVPGCQELGCRKYNPHEDCGESDCSAALLEYFRRMARKR